MMDTLRYYRDHKGKWRWQYVAANGRILADSGQGYSRRDKAEQGWRHLELAIAGSPANGTATRPWFEYRTVVDDDIPTTPQPILTTNANGYTLIGRTQVSVS